MVRGAGIGAGAVIAITLKDAFSKNLQKAGRRAEGTFSKMGKSANRAGTHFRSFFAAFAGVGALAGGVFILGKAMRAVAQETSATEKALVQLDAILKSTGFSAGMNKNEMVDMAKAMGDVSVFSDSVLLKSTGIMATFTKIGKETFPEAMKSAMDMSSVFGQSLQQSVIQLGTALNDPIAGVGRLMRIGISFTAQQRTQIEEMMKTNDIMGAQAVIVDELKRELGGAAEAELQTFSGQVKQMGANLLTLAANIGSVFTKNEEWIASLKGVNKWLKKVGEIPLDELVLEKLQVLVNGFFEFWGNLQPESKAALVAWGQTWMVQFIAIKHLLMGLWRIIVEFFKDLPTNASAAIDLIVNTFRNMGNFIKRLILSIGLGWENFVLGIKKGMNESLDTINNLREAIGLDKIGDPLDISGNQKKIRQFKKQLKEVDTQIKSIYDEGQGFSEGFKDALSFEGTKEEMKAEIDAMMESFNDLLDPEDAKKMRLDLLSGLEKKKQDKKKDREEKKKADDIFIADFKSSIGGEMNKLVGALTVLGDDMKKLGGDFGKAIIDGGKALEDFIMKGVGQLVSDHFGRQARADATGFFTDKIEGEMAADTGMQEMQSNLDAALADGNEELAKSIQSAMATRLGDAVAATQPVSDFFGGLMGGITGGLTQMLLGKLFGRGKKKAVEKPVPVKVVNWGDMTQELLKASSRRAVSPMIASPGNSMMSSDFSRDTRF